MSESGLKPQNMEPKLISFRAGFTNLFLLVQEGRALLVDTGTTGLANQICNSIQSFGLELSDVKYILLTHSHYDHAGSVADLKKLTEAKIIIHSSEAAYLENGFTPIPFGTNPLFKTISAMGRWKVNHRRIASYPAVAADILFEHKLDLNPYGFDAVVLHTPGHTLGSCSLVSGKFALVGDAMFNMFGTYYPGFANDEKALRNSWSQFSMMNLDWFYPSHGRRISKENFIRQANKKGIK